MLILHTGTLNSVYFGPKMAKNMTVILTHPWSAAHQVFFYFHLLGGATAVGHQARLCHTL